MSTVISVVIPIFNESAVLEELHGRLRASLEALGKPFEVIFVDDGSVDDSAEKLSRIHKADSRFKILSLSRNFGHQAAFLAGLKHSCGEYVILMDGDLQDPPEMIPDLVRTSDEGYEIVYAVRKNRKEWWHKRIAYWAFYRLFDLIAGVQIPLDAGDFSLVRRKALDVMLSMPEQSLFLRGLRSWVGFRQFGIEYNRSERFAGAPKYSFKCLLRLAMNAIYSFSEVPVKLLGFLGWLVLASSVGYSIFLLSKYFLYGSIPEGFPTLALMILFFSSVQMIFLSVIGQYLVRTFNESRGRPLFIVSEFLE